MFGSGGIAARSTLSMSLIAIDAAGKKRTVKVGAKLGGGASAEVFRELGGHGMALKLYSSDYLVKYPDQPGRMLAMLSRPPAQQAIAYKGKQFTQIAWPKEILKDSANGRFVGFSMPLIDTSGATELENLKTKLNRSYSGLREDLAFRLNVARNLAALVYEIHRVGHTIVDLKPLNLMVYKDTGFVAILDCDGFSIQSKSRKYPGALATDDYRGPECAVLPNASFGPKQDQFALAIIIWQILNDAHPFTGRQSGNVHFTIQERINRGLYAYGLTAHPLVSPMKTSRHADWPTSVRRSFDVAFAGKVESRPTAREWRDTLEDLKAKVKRCPRNARHEYVLDDCPFCVGNIAGTFTSTSETGGAKPIPSKKGKIGPVPQVQPNNKKDPQQAAQVGQVTLRARVSQMFRWLDDNSKKLALGAGVVAVPVAAVYFSVFAQKAIVTSGPAIVAHTLQLNVRNCPKPPPACRKIAILNEGDGVFVTEAFDNGWNAVTIRQNDGSVIRGYVNGSYLSSR